ncbi:alkylated DNA repair protein ALKBH6 homolog isoform X1 [Primulina huaijiensis]|uniref:alkylated DNA repair protein ALKBH6 homolog isoform X1 n=1 Tax=Primulina huaijiensis TaxID=1492673 RepID=UPI003CC78D4B
MDVETSALEEFVVGFVPTVFYLPDYVTAAEEEQLLNNIYKAPISKWRTLKNRRLQNWGGIVHDKGLLAQGLPPWLEHVTHRIYAESKLFPSAINHVLINEYLFDQGIMPHQDGPAYVPVVAILSLGSPVIMNFTPHQSFKNAGGMTGINNDTISESAPSHMNESLSEHRPFSVALMSRSLLIFKDAAYSDYLHGIEDSELQLYDEAINVNNALLGDGQVPAISDLKIVSSSSEYGGGTIIHRTGTRISLTCRVVLKVHKSLVKLKI